MCKVTDQLILCTCSGEVDTSKPHWILRKQESRQVIIGSPRIDYSESLDASKLAKTLNAGTSVFDFDYNPEVYDMLLIYLDHASGNLQAYCYIYSEFGGGGSDLSSILDYSPGWSFRGLYDASKSKLYNMGKVKRA